MCGIAGFVGEGRRGAAVEDLRAMCDAIVHRGPDDAGYLVAPEVALGMRRLSIIDIAGSLQPMANEDGSIQVVFNGEIYNYREIRAELIRNGHVFRSSGDTEVLVHLYEDHGDQLVHHLRGMFAFALWDARRRRLLVARDRLGIKPLYYWDTGEGIAFASELKSLLALDDFPRQLDAAAVAHYLALGYVPDPQCVFANVKKLPPGCVLTWQADRNVEVKRYWSPLVPEQPSITEGEAMEEIRRLLTEAVRYRLISDVPLGAFLSGGIDSSAIVAEMARQMDRPVQTFSIGFEEPRFNEAPHAAAVARVIGTDHHELVVRPDVDRLIEKVVDAFDEPFADASAIPTFLVSALARERVTVVLSGDGGDELFGGYTRYLDAIRRDVSIPAAMRGLLGTLARRLPQSAYGRRRLLELSRTRRGRYTGMVAHALAVEEGGVARPELVRAVGALDDLLAACFDAIGNRDPSTQAMLVDAMSYLPGDILTKVDRASMAVSLEARVPLLDHHLVEFAFSLPSGLKLRDGQGKWIFREAIKDLVPRSVLTKPKQGFSVPLQLWFRNELRHRMDALLLRDAPVYEFAERAAVHRVVTEHLSGRRSHTGLVWRLVVLDLWLRNLRHGAGERGERTAESLRLAVAGAAPSVAAAGRPLPSGNDRTLFPDG